MKLIYVGFSFIHHGEHTGYDLISKYLPYDKFVKCQVGFNRLSNFNKRQNLLTKGYGKIFKGWLWWVELQLIFISLFNPGKYTFHLIYGENLYRFLCYFKFKNRIVLSLHQPVSYFEKEGPYFLRQNLKRVDKIIVLSFELKKYFELKYPDIPVKYIPHGIDCSFFKPEGQRNKLLLMVGNWFRDFTFANTVFTEILNVVPDIEICVVTNQTNHHFFTKHSSIKLMSNISDKELLSLYQQAHCLFLPLFSFTANNAILEAASAGCPIVVATNLIDNSYFSDKQITFLPLQKNQVVDFLSRHLKERFDMEKSSSLVDFVKNNYAWEEIATITFNFINEN
jgi:glycosyltransferase involved in cell wall biosynthesis